MATQQMTLNKALDMAVEKLPYLRRKVTQTRLQNQRYRQHVLDELALTIHEEPLFQEYGIPVQGAEFNAETTFGIDVTKLSDFLDLIIKYLPTILALILKFMSIGFVGICLSVPSTAMAQDCTTGQCPLRQPTKAPLLSILEAPVVTVLETPVVQAVLPPYRHTNHNVKPPVRVTRKGPLRRLFAR